MKLERAVLEGSKAITFNELEVGRCFRWYQSSDVCVKTAKGTYIRCRDGQRWEPDCVTRSHALEVVPLAAVLTVDKA